MNKLQKKAIDEALGLLSTDGLWGALIPIENLHHGYQNRLEREPLTAEQVKQILAGVEEHRQRVARAREWINVLYEGEQP